MPQILIRNLDSAVVKRLKRQAKRHGRSLQGEARHILRQSVEMNSEHVLKTARQRQKRLAGRKFPDTTQLLRQDRGR